MNDDKRGPLDGRSREAYIEEASVSNKEEHTLDTAVSSDVTAPHAGEDEAAETASLPSPSVVPSPSVELEGDHQADTSPEDLLAQQPDEPQARVGDAEAPVQEALPPVPESEQEVSPAADVAATNLAAPDDGVATSAGTELEEMTLPSSIPTLDPLPDGATVDPEGSIVVERLREKRGRVNRYLATRRDESGEQLAVELLEAPVDHAGLQCEAEMLSQVTYPMLPKLYASWERDGRRYLAIERLEGPTLAETLEAGMSTDEVVSVALQIAQALRQLHRAGWALVGLSPDGVYVGRPIRVAQVGAAMRIGEEPAHALHVPGYSAPELAHRAAITGKEDVYTLGAMLYRGLSGQPAPEQGPELAALATSAPAPGAPQLLASALDSSSERIDLEEFYRRLLTFKRRLSLAPLALRVASGTTIGLNQTRLANEDACGYLTWCTAYEGRVAYNAVLCAIDGMGGMEAGEVASTAALRAALSAAASYSVEQISGADGADREPGADSTDGGPATAGSPQRSLDPKGLVQAAAEAAYTAARGRQVGATITCAVVDDGKLTLAHVGDTRAYLLRDGALTRLTRDHSLVAAMVASGMLTEDQARGHPESNKVLRSLGGQKTLPDGYIDGLTVAHGEDVLRLNEGDQLLFCSDGVWGVLDDDALLVILTESPDPETAVETAIRRVLEGGAPDNAAIIVARCVSMPAS